MSKSLAVPPRVLIDSTVRALPVTLQPYAGAVLENTSMNAWFQAHFTPTGTSGTVNADTLAVSGCTASLIQNQTGASGGDLPTHGTVVLIAARRKEGTSGAIANQEIVISINSVEVARIEVDGASEQYGVHFTAQPEDKGDPLYNIHTYPSIAFTCTAADSDVEVCLFIGGYHA